MTDPLVQTSEASIGVVLGEVFCPECGYDLRAITSERCPECGFVVNRATLIATRIPWVHRSALGRWKAYRRTNLMVLFRPRVLADEFIRLVDYRSAQLFRQITVLIAAIPLIVLALDLYLSNYPLRDFPHGSRLGWALQFICMGVGVAAV